MNAEPNGRRLHLFTAVILLAVFAAGAAAGAGITWALRTPPGHAPGPRPGAPRQAGGGAGLPPPFAALGLSPEQEKGVRAVLEAHRPELEKAIEEAFPRVRAVQEATEREVRALLTPEQAARLDELQARRSRRGGPLGGPPPGPPPGPAPDDGPPPVGPGGHPRPPPPR